MRKFMLALLLSFISVFFFSFSKHSRQEPVMDLVKIIPSLSVKQFNEIKKVSIKDTKGFKYVINELGKNKFSKFITTTSKQKLTKKDEKKITDIIKKYS